MYVHHETLGLLVGAIAGCVEYLRHGWRARRKQ